jgi:hypothetical protein
MSTITTKTEAAGLLRAHLPEAVSRELVWSSLEVQRGSFIDDRLRAGAPWPLIESATGIDQAALRALKRRLETSSTTTEPTEGSANGAEDTE